MSRARCALATLRESRTRSESLFAYEAGRPNVLLRPALEYLGVPRLQLTASDTSDELPPDTVPRYVADTVRHWHAPRLAEEWCISLAVLMYDLR